MAPRIKAISTPQAAGTRANVYRNLHNGLWSLRGSDGKVAGHSPNAVLHDVKFKVGEAGRQRVIREKSKNVHAVIQGTVKHVDAAEVPPHAVPVSYNPYKAGHFYRKDTGEAVHHADAVHMTPQGVFAINPRSDTMSKGVLGNVVGAVMNKLRGKAPAAPQSAAPKPAAAPTPAAAPKPARLTADADDHGDRIKFLSHMQQSPGSPARQDPAQHKALGHLIDAHSHMQRAAQAHAAGDSAQAHQWAGGAKVHLERAQQAHSVIGHLMGEPLHRQIAEVNPAH